MKRHLVLFLALLALLLTCSLTVFAHSGRTDENGGHYDTSTGEYHYHHGWPAHRHDGGKCPYDLEDNVDYNRNDTSDPNQKTTNTSNIPPWLQYAVVICFLLPLPLGGLFVFKESFREYRQQPTRKKLYDLWFFSALGFLSIVGFVMILITIFTFGT